MTVRKARSSDLEKIQKNRSEAAPGRIEIIPDNEEEQSVVELPEDLTGKIEASRKDLSARRMIENKLLRKEVRIWLKNR